MLSLNTNVNAIYASRALSQSTQKINNLNHLLNSASNSETDVAITPTYLTASINGLRTAQSNQIQSEALVSTASTSISNILAALKSIQLAQNNPNNPALQVNISDEVNYITQQYAADQYNKMSLLNGSGNFNFQIGPNISDNIQISLPNISTIITAVTNPSMNSQTRDQAITDIQNAQTITAGISNDLKLIDDGLTKMLNIQTTSRDTLINNATSKAQAELANQKNIQQSAQLMLQEANSEMKSVLDLIKSAMIPAQ